jgi:hypothetical protein
MKLFHTAVLLAALTLFRKANRLCYEQTRNDTTEPRAPAGRIDPGHVYEVVNAALDRQRKTAFAGNCRR